MNVDFLEIERRIEPSSLKYKFTNSLNMKLAVIFLPT